MGIAQRISPRAPEPTTPNASTRTFEVGHLWPASLDALGLERYAAERAALFDAALAGHLWRAAERVPAPASADERALEQRALLYGRLAHHHHAPVKLGAGQSHRWARLEVMRFTADTRVEIDEGIAFSVGAVLTHASLERLLDPAAVKQLDALIGQALDGDIDATRRLERLVPIAQARLRARLDATPEATGGPSLRTILVTYEE